VCPPDAAGVRGGEEIGLQLKSTLGRVASGRSRRAPLAESTAARHSQYARVYSGVLRVVRGGSGAEAPPLAARWIMIFDFVIVNIWAHIRARDFITRARRHFESHH